MSDAEHLVTGWGPGEPIVDSVLRRCVFNQARRPPVTRFTLLVRPPGASRFPSLASWRRRRTAPAKGIRCNSA